MASGGYKVIDFKHVNVPIGSGTATIEGIYEAVESSSKALLVKNLVSTSNEFADFFSHAYAAGQNFQIPVQLTTGGYLNTIVVRPDDTVSYSATKLTVE